MPSIEFEIRANYDKVDEAYAKIDALKKLVESFKSDSPQGISIVGDINKEQKNIDALVEEIRLLKQAQAQQAQSAIEENKKHAEEIKKLTNDYKALIEQMGKASSVSTPKIETPKNTLQNQASQPVEQEAMAYEELNRQLLLIAGSRQNNITRLMREQAALASVKKELADLTKEEKNSGKVTQEQKQRRTDLVNAEFEHKQSIAALQQIIKNDVKLNQEAEGSYARLSLSLEKMKKVYKGLGEEAQNSSFGVSLQKQIESTDKKLKEFGKTIGESQRNVGNYPDVWNQFAQSADGALDAVSALPGPLGEAASGIKGITKASLAFIATPVGAVIAAIVAALAVLSSWFTRTEEGQNALNVSSAYFKQTLDSILDVVDDLGEWLYNAFTKPKEALQDLSDFLEDQVMVRLKSLGRMGEAVMKIFSGDLKGGAADFGNAWLEQITGIENAGQKAVKFIEEINEKAQKRAVLADRENKLAIEQREWLVERSKLEAKINELREKSQDSSLTEKERLKASKEASVIINQMYEKEQKLAIENRDIIAETNKLSHSNAQAKDKEAKATAEINKLDAERAAKNRELLSQQKELNNQIKTRIENENRQKVQVANRIREIEEAQKKISEKEVEAELKIEQNRINAMEEGADKTLAQIQYNYQRQIAEVTKFGNELVKAHRDTEEKAWKAANPNWEKEGKIFEPSIKSISQLPQEELEIIAQLLKSVEDLTERQQTDLLKKTLDKYKDYGTQRLEIEKKLNDDIKYLESQRTEENSKQIDAAITEARKKTEKELSNISFAEFKDSDLWSKMFSDLEKMALPTLQNILEQAKKVNTEGFSPEQIKEYQDAIERLEEAVRTRNPFKSIQDDWEKLIKAMKKGSKDDIASALSGIDSAVQKINSDLKTIGSGIGDIFGDDAGYAAGQVTELTSALGGFVTAGSKIASGDILGGVTSVVSSIGSIFSMGKKVKEMNAAARAEQQKFYDEAKKGEMEYQALLRERARLEQQLGETSIAYNSRITAELDSQKKIIDAQVKSLMSQLQQENYISGVGYRHGTWFRKAKTWNEYESLMGKTYEDIEALYMSNKLDGKAKELFEQLQKLKEEGIEIDEMLVEQAEAFKEYLSGMTLDSLKESIKEAFDDGKFDIQDAADFTKQVFKKAILQALEAKVLEKALQPFLESFQADAEAGTLFEPGKMDYYQEWIKKIGEEGNAFMDNLMKLPEIADIFNNEATRSAQAKGIAAMSQDTADKLDGKFTAGLIYLDKMTTSSYDIAGSIKELTRQSYDGWKNVEAIKGISRNIEVLSIRIADNTEDIGTILKSINKNTGGANESLDNMNRNGLYLKR